MDFDQPPVVRVEVSPESDLPAGRWPMTIPAVAQVAREGMDLAKGVTFLVGENGSGKSTIVEAVAMAFGLNPEGGSTGARHTTRPTESPLGTALRVQRGLAASRWGFFLRAETMHGWYSYIEQNPKPPSSPNPDPRFSTSSATASRSSPCWRPASRAAGSTASTSPRPHCRSPRRWP